MLTLNYLRSNSAEAIERLKKRNNLNAEPLINEVLLLDSERRSIQVELDSLLAKANGLSKEIGDLFKQGKAEDANAKKQETVTIKEQTVVLEASYKEKEEAITALLVQIPNTPHTSISLGAGADDNDCVQTEGEIPKLHEGSLPHWELAKKYDIIDFDLGAKITGAGFPVYKGKGAKLQRALIAYFLDKASEAGYNEYQVPHLINADSGFGTGQLPDKEGQMYYATADDLYLIPTAEVPITNIFRDVILQERDLPVKCCGYTPCFRREAGSYGAHVRGLNRLHQFDKIEIVQIVKPEESYKVLEDMRNHVASILKELKLPFRVLRLCGGDMGFASAFTYDFETFSAAQEKWLEVSSTSNFETFQANRLKLRYKDETNKTQLAHTLNGSALALPRILATILENYQTESGIKIPEVLIPYTKFDIID